MRKLSPAAVVGVLAAVGLFFYARDAEARRRDAEFDSDAEAQSYAENEVTYDMPPVPTTHEFASVLDWMLPPVGTIRAHLTGTFDEMRGSTRHGAVDFNYIGGQNGINLQHPAVRTPIDGEVTFSGGQYGTVKIEDSNGYSHEFLHLQTRAVSAGQHVTAGDVIGTMGGRGPLGANQYAQHVHYQLKTPSGTLIDPVGFWNS